MEMKKYIHKWCCMLFILLGFACGSVPYENWKQQEFIDHWKKVRTTVVEKNLKGYLSLTEAPDPMITQQGFEELIEFGLYSFPEWKKVKLVKFEQNDKAAMLVLRIRLDHEEIITLAAYKFVLRESGWKMTQKFYQSSFNVWSDTPEEKGEKEQKAIEEKLNEKADFQLIPEKKE